ncbi:RNA pyrophosphohydrolase [Skermanella stibiiresistens SB22]|uniref:RNA pyrophosphohydrolase n=1 Tax=Skermanella stibiiresistens SB22 TaxID=1385369 RepID=W9GYI1_9PROT|nr:RNA pyrophosphohydrolase [Skermanella stibiiresistens]EWY37507.1 RNA pyrophosphohydrolase [Skermanella stibiiresistens SB22]
MSKEENKALKLPYRPCVGIMLVNAEGKVFVGRRIDTPEGWQMPQGGIDPGETPRQAAARELLEEIGTGSAEIVAETAGWLRYDLPAHLIGKVWKGRYRGQEQKWVLARFTGTDADIDLATEHPEFDDWQWAAPADLPRMIVPFKRAIYEAVVTEFLPLITPTPN